MIWVGPIIPYISPVDSSAREFLKDATTCAYTAHSLLDKIICLIILTFNP